MTEMLTKEAFLEKVFNFEKVKNGNLKAKSLVSLTSTPIGVNLVKWLLLFWKS